MDTFEKQSRILTIAGVLLLLSALSLAVIIPAILQDPSPDAIPLPAAIATAVVAGVHLLLFFAFLYGVRLSNRKRHFNRKINLSAAVVVFILGLIILDGATAYLGQILMASVGMFVCVFCDLTAVVVLVAALFILRPKKKKQPETGAL